MTHVVNVEDYGEALNKSIECFKNIDIPGLRVFRC